MIFLINRKNTDLFAEILILQSVNYLKFENVRKIWKFKIRLSCDQPYNSDVRKRFNATFPPKNLILSYFILSFNPPSYKQTHSTFELTQLVATYSVGLIISFQTQGYSARQILYSTVSLNLHSSFELTDTESVGVIIQDSASFFSSAAIFDPKNAKSIIIAKVELAVEVLKYSA